MQSYPPPYKSVKTLTLDSLYRLLDERGLNPKREGDGIRSQCPAHDSDRQGKNAKFWISPHGHPIARCFSHDCPPKSIRSALSLPTFESRYPYEGRDGSVEVAVRTTTRTGKKYAMPGSRERHPLIYGSEGSIVVVEGETAAEAVVNACVGSQTPHRAVSFPGGAAAHRAWILDRLADEPLILWPDADEVGRKSWNALASRLLPIAAEVRMVEVDDLPNHSDADDLAPSEVLSRIAGATLYALTPDPIGRSVSEFGLSPYDSAARVLESNAANLLMVRHSDGSYETLIAHWSGRWVDDDSLLRQTIISTERNFASNRLATRGSRKISARRSRITTPSWESLARIGTSLSHSAPPTSMRWSRSPSLMG